MVKNPLYRNEYYFFSNMYDDSLITDFYKKISRESYDRSINYQHNMIGRKRHLIDNAIFYKESLGNFIVDDKYNLTVGIPLGSRIIKFNTMVIPVINKRKYIATYGARYKKIPLIDFYKRNDIFDKSITLQIERYRIFAAYIIENIDKTVTLAIPNSAIDGIGSESFNRILSRLDSDEPVWLFSDEITSCYFSDTSITNITSASATNGQYEICIPRSDIINNIGKTKDGSSNSWDCLMSVSHAKYGKDVLVATSCTFKGFTTKNNKNYALFYVNKEYIDYIKSNGFAIRAYFINRPNRKHLFHYSFNENNSPILNLDYSENPSGNINIEVFEFDSYKMTKERRLYDPEFSQIYFPNIFDFSKLNTNSSDLLIEVTEYSSGYTNQKMTNSLRPLIDSLGSDFYTEFVVNGYDKSLDGTSMNLKDYHPTSYPVSADDYINSEYYGDYRGYILDKISKTIESDPYLISSYYDWIGAKFPQVVSKSGTPKTFRFGTGKTGEFSGSNDIVRNTSFVSVISDDIQYFDEDHSYISYYSSGNKCPANVYVNGKYVKPTCFRHYKGVNYLFFPVKMISDAMAVYSTEAELIAAAPISLDFYPGAYMSSYYAPVNVFTINSMNDIFTPFKHTDNAKFSINDLVAYDSSTGKYLGSLIDLFNINLKVSEYIVNNPGETSRVLLSRETDPKYLLTILNEIYCTSDEIPILIGNESISLSFNDFIDYLISEGVISEDQKTLVLNKKLRFSDIELSPKDETLIGLSVTLYSRSFKSEYVIDSLNGIYDSNLNKTIYTLESANIDPDINRYFVYIDGVLAPDAEIYVDGSFYGMLSVILDGNRIVNTDSKITIVHMPIDYIKEEFNFSKRVFYMGETNNQTTNPDMIWKSEDGLLLLSYSNDNNTSYSFEDCRNIKFSSIGLRLPPLSESTNSVFSQYYDYGRMKVVNNMRELSNDVNTGIVYRPAGDIPIMNINVPGPNLENYNISDIINPLDILTHVGLTKNLEFREITTNIRIWQSVCYGNGMFVAVSLNSNIFAYSYDGINWTEGTISDTRRQWYSVCYGNGIFVAVAFNSKIFAYSTDGIHWTEGTISNISRVWSSVCYGNGMFVAVTYDSNIFAYSYDGINWREGTISDSNRSWQSVCYGNDKFVAVARGSNIFAYSYDGINWTEGTISDTERYWQSICYSNGMFVAVARGSKIFAYSYDGITWIEVTVSNTKRNWESICYGNDKFVAVAYISNIFAYSYDGITWRESTISDTIRNWNSVCYGNDKFVAVVSDSKIFAHSI